VRVRNVPQKDYNRSLQFRARMHSDPIVDLVKSISAVVASATEFIAVIVIVVGALQAITSLVAALVRRRIPVDPLAVFRSFAGWLVLALELLLAADILRTAISPTWTDIGQLAAIAAIRTFLNYSLSHDLRHSPEKDER
jgi:uncharacterized membrane protein